MKNFIKVTSDQQPILINTSKILTVKPLEVGAEIILDEPTTPTGWNGAVSTNTASASHNFTFKFKNRCIITSESFDSLLVLIEEAQ